jgi:hypothetical protein
MIRSSDDLMSRRVDLNCLYEILDDLRKRIGGCRRLRDCTGKSGWPERGVYFFFEDGEFREDRKTLRVVRVGTHAITATSRTTLWNRLHTHRGHSDLGGNHRGSIFRKRIGEALWKTKNHPNDLTRTWGIGSSAEKSDRLNEVPLEREVSTYIGQMPFLWIEVPDVPSPRSDRADLELNCIALLSNFEKPPIDSPSPNWLGCQSGERTIRESGLWNTDHVKKPYDPVFLEKLRAYVHAAGRVSRGPL